MSVFLWQDGVSEVQDRRWTPGGLMGRFQLQQVFLGHFDKKLFTWSRLPLSVFLIVLILTTKQLLVNVRQAYETLPN